MYLNQYQTRQTPQSERADPRQFENSAGGYTFPVDDWARLRRFLILGTEGGTYYATERKLTVENAEALKRCILEDGPRAVALIREVSLSGVAPKNDPALFALAMAAGVGNTLTRKTALAALPDVARIGTHLFHFAEYVQGFRGWGRLLRNAVADWYQRKPVATLQIDVAKYRQRDGWSQRDLLRLAKPVPVDDEHRGIYAWVTGKDSAIPYLRAFDDLQGADWRRAVQLINDYGFTHEMLPTELKTRPEIWDALLENMPMTAMIRNLATMTRVGLLKPMSEASKLVRERLEDGVRLRKARIHPIQALVALMTYQAGRGVKSQHTWVPVAQISEALESAFYLAFGNVEASGKRTLIGLDVSGSMGYLYGDAGVAGVIGLTPAMASAAMCMVTARTEQQYEIMGFADSFRGLGLTASMSLREVMSSTSAQSFGGTDCALPMLWALQNGVEVDTFIVYTDNETWAGDIHPHQALERYRQKTGIGGKLIVVGMTSNGFSIADPTDAGMLDVVGFDASAPALMADFAK